MRRTRIPTRPYSPGESNTPRSDIVRRRVRTFAEYEAEDFAVTVNGIRSVLLQKFRISYDESQNRLTI